MKIGILLVGSSYNDVRINANPFGRDWRLSKDNLKSNLINCFKSSHEVSLYLTTYDNPYIEELKQFYNPKKTTILPFDGSHQRTTLASSVEDILQEDLDFIIVTRFDISFNDFVSSWNIDYDKINFVFKDCEDIWNNNRSVGDCLHAFSKKYLESFISSVREEHSCGGQFLHGMYNRMSSMIGSDNIHFIHEGYHASDTNEIYKLNRVKID
jgi:hypothetical protein